MKGFRIAAVLAACTLAMPALAVPLCIERGDAEDLIAFVLPSLVDIAGATCGATLPAGSPLAAGSGLAARYRAEAESAWPGAKSAVGRLTDKSLLALLDDKALRKLLGETVADKIGRQITIASCASIDQLMTGLAPLPARNVARVIVALVDLAGRTKERSPLRLCPADAAR